MKKEKIATVDISCEDVVDFVCKESDGLILLNIIRACCVRLAKINIKPIINDNSFFVEKTKHFLKNLQKQLED